MNPRILLAAMLAMTEGNQKDYDIPVNTEGMKAVHAKLRKEVSIQQPSKRRLKKMRGKKK